ncbi:MerR family transcriptional regulator [Ureibacillus sp. GCM10028918]|uniref:MerR family transcriptional regulator n=1 Tax=Ureibacillus sp. GCM10028918 TaxID=3273429 RepID=UPI0036074FF9
MSELTVVSETSTSEELIYNTATVSKILSIHEKTLRRYCTLMQNYNYNFQKNRNGHRLYYQQDIEIIKRIIHLKNSSSLTLEQAVKVTLGLDVDSEEEKVNNESTSSDFDYNQLLTEFTTFKNDQMEFNKKLLEQLIKQEHYIKNSIEERDKKLMFAMKESMETRRQLAAAAEAERESEQKKKIWWQFWK